MNYKDAMDYLEKTGKWDELGFTTDAERKVVDPAMVVEYATLLKETE